MALKENFHTESTFWCCGWFSALKKWTRMGQKGAFRCAR